MQARVLAHGPHDKVPRDDKNNPCNLTAIMGYKAGMAHIVRVVHKSSSNQPVVVRMIALSNHQVEL
jgi:hypothetical protein